MMTWVKRVLLPVRSFWSDRPSVDWLLVGVVLALHACALWFDWFDWIDGTLADLAKDDRMRVFTTLATVSSLLFGFATASIAFFYGSAKGERLDLLKQVMNQQIVRTWRGALAAPLITVGVALAAMSFDTKADGRAWVAWLVEGAVVFLAARAFRLRWLFTMTLNLLSHDIQNPQKQVAPVSTTSAPVAVRPQPRSTTTSKP
jgi:hypothetical protein